jgi:STAS domain
VEPTPRRSVVVIDVGALDRPDPLVLEALARLQLVAHRFGVSVELHNACGELIDLLALVGLSEVLPLAAGSGVEPDRQTEQRKEVLIDEEVERGDPTA